MEFREGAQDEGEHLMETEGERGMERAYACMSPICELRAGSMLNATTPQCERGDVAWKVLPLV